MRNNARRRLRNPSAPSDTPTPIPIFAPVPKPLECELFVPGVVPVVVVDVAAPVVEGEVAVARIEPDVVVGANT
jgi:hypothetical protein